MKPSPTIHQVPDRQLGYEEQANYLPSPSLTPSPTSASPVRKGSDAPEEKSTLSHEPLPHNCTKEYGSDTAEQSRDRPNIEALASRDDERKRSVDGATSPSAERDRFLKLSPAKIQELTSSPTSLPVRVEDESSEPATSQSSSITHASERAHTEGKNGNRMTVLQEKSNPNGVVGGREGSGRHTAESKEARTDGVDGMSSAVFPKGRRPDLGSRASSTPVLRRKQSSAAKSRGQPHETSEKGHRPPPLNLGDSKRVEGAPSSALKPSPIPETISPPASSLPLPPLSLPTYLQLELSTERPSPLYIHRPSNAESLYESSKIKLERLKDFLSLCFYFEPFVWFGFFACLDAWLYLITILPLRFLRALWILSKWWVYRVAKEVRDIASFIYWGIGRVWRRRHGARSTPASTNAASSASEGSKSRRGSASQGTDGGSRVGAAGPQTSDEHARKYRGRGFRHRRSKSAPSALKPSHKADLLRGLLVIASCSVLMRYDASRMYHSIRGQAAIKLYVIYNALEVGDRLLSALGQDVLECLFCDENLERDIDGRSKVMRPLWMFIFALSYTILHATALFYQVITLNVAVNSYSNALLTLLMSNQFVEIKSSVFKKIEKENLFQLACADIVERFQLWLMLLIIAMRNVVEVGGLSISLSSAMTPVPGEAQKANTSSSTFGGIIPQAFTILPDWIGQVLTPFLFVLCSEMVVDWIKHAYTCKFNNVKSNIYGRFLDVIAKDYYSHAFAEQNLTKRLGLPVIPLVCLFIRALVQTYHMFLATHMPPPLPSPATSLLVDDTVVSTPATTAALAHIDQLFRRALGRSSFGTGTQAASSSDFTWWSVDDMIAFATMAVVFLIFYLLVLAFKLLLGMCLLGFSRRRYKGMKDRERQVVDTTGRRIGLWGMTELGDERRKLIYADDPDGLQAMRERERKGAQKAEKGKMDLDPVQRYAMVGKRIW